MEEWEAEVEILSKHMTGALGHKDEKVLTSFRIVNSPRVLTKSKYSWSANKGRIMKVHSYMVSEKTVEISPKHFIMTERKKEAA